MTVSMMRPLLFGAAALTLAACGQSVDQAAAPASPPEAAAAGAASADVAAIAPAPTPEVPASSAIDAGPGTGPEGYNAPAPMSNPTSPTGQGNPPSDVLSR